MITRFLAYIGLIVTSTVTVEAFKTAQQPNVIFILIDDMGFGDLSCTGNTDVETQHIDRLAREGSLFKQFYVASPICSPSRVAFTTGQYPACLLYTSPSPRDRQKSRMPSSA